MNNPFPYVNAYGSIDKLFEAIRKASVPSKFTNNFLSTMLGFKSSSHRALIPFLKKLEFINQDNVPTELYKKYRDQTSSRRIMAQAIRKAFEDLFMSDEYAYRLDKGQLKGKIKTITGLPEGNTLEAIVNSFLNLVKLADFQGEAFTPSIPRQELPKKPETYVKHEGDKKGIVEKIGISYTINLNLPATPDIQIFNAIFKSLKENLLND